MARVTGAVALALLAVLSPGLAAARQVEGPDGTIYSAWVVRGDGLAAGTAVTAGSVIAWSASGSHGTRLGTVAATTDGSEHSAPQLAIDRSAGGPVIVWSHVENGQSRIAWARFDGDAWVEAHDLTFGDGDQREPRLGISRDGAFLFWIADGERIDVAPVELSGGRLLAAPRDLLRLGVPLEPGTATVEGAVDVPVILPGNGNKNDGSSKKSSVPPLLIAPPDQTVQGGYDVPVVLNNPGSPTLGSLWGVGSRGDCRHLFLAVPDTLSRLLQIYGFVNGNLTRVGRGPLPASAPAGYADAAAGAYLGTTCN